MNVLSKEKQITVIGGLAEGGSIRSIERITGVHRDTIMRLGVRVGNACHKLLDQKMRGLNCRSAMAAGVETTHLSVADLIEFADHPHVA